jgi:hypothetical protein
MEDDESLHCPVCRARFRESSTCSRCGADLGPLMLLIAGSYQRRKEAAQSLLAGDYERAHRLASEAQEIRFTRRGADLERLSAWLVDESAPQVSASLPDDSIAGSKSCGPFGRPDLTAPFRGGPTVIRCLILAGIVGLGWAATGEAINRLKRRGD